MSQTAVRTVVSGLGQTMITVAVLIALYVVYLTYTPYRSQQEEPLLQRVEFYRHHRTDVLC